MKSSFKKGDLVQLKSGGPVMTVEDPNAYGNNVLCQWFSGAKLNEGSFDPEVLKAVTLPDSNK